MMTTELPKDVGRRVRRWRTRAALTQEQLASRTGLTNETISRIERGTVVPQFSSLWKIADALGVPVETFTNPIERL